MDPGGSRPPAGWYPDPSGAPGQRYFDGVDWTPHVVATQRPGGQTVVVTGPNHAVHAILTVNVRLVGADMAHRRLSQQAEGAGEAVVTRPGWYRNPAGPGHRYWDGRRWTIVSIPPTVRRPSFAAQHPVLICLAVLVGLSLVVAYWWFFLALAVVIAVLYGCIILAHRYQSRQDDEARRRAELAARADYEHQLWTQGDPRGFYGQYPGAPL